MKIVVSFLLLIGATVAVAQEIPFEVEQAMANIRPAAIRGHMQFLADDLTEGRGTGSRGYLIAARYVASQFDAAGLSPAGVDGTWFQAVPFRSATVKGATAELSDGRTKRPFALDRDFIASPYFFEEKVSVSAPVVFVGYGITAPSLGVDDYKGLDVRGKMVVVVNGAPENFPNLQRAHYSSSLVKTRNAVEHGAVGLLWLRTSEEEKFPWERAVGYSKLPSLRWMQPDGLPHNVFRELRASGTLSRDGAAAIFGSRAKVDQLLASVKKSRRRPRVPSPTLSMTTESAFETMESPNVAGVLRGSDPLLRDEYLVYSSHLDHIGIGRPVDGDSIYNGAFDNASGIAVMLEIARSFAELKERPRRSIIFLATTGEEKGLQGSDYFANNPTVPRDRLVANINIDELYLAATSTDVVILGQENSTLGDVAVAAARRAGLEISPDPHPQKVYFVRSDQYPFVKAGVPAIYAYSGYKSADPAVDVKKMFEEWEETRYHRPNDDLKQPMKFEAALPLARFDFLAGWMVANAAERPQWRKGDFFGELFGK